MFQKVKELPRQPRLQYSRQQYSSTGASIFHGTSMDSEDQVLFDGLEDPEAS